MARTQIAVLNDLQRSGDAPLEFQLVPLVLMDHWNKWRVTALLSDSEGRLDKITNAGEYLPHKNFVICDLEERKFLQVTVSRGTVYYRSVRPSGVPTAGHPLRWGWLNPSGSWAEAVASVGDEMGRWPRPASEKVEAAARQFLSRNKKS